jgi:eukaryotic-like serine/threonine-protein kinase
LPGGKAVFFVAVRPGGDYQVAVQLVGAGERRNLIPGGNQPRYAPSGHLVYAQSGSLMAVPFDIQRLTMTGPPAAVVMDVQQDRGTGVAQYSVSTTGSLVYVRGNVDVQRRLLVWVDRQGREQTLLAPPRRYGSPRLSPDGQRLAVDSDEGTVWIDDLARSTLTRLTQESSNGMPNWTPDERRIAFYSNKDGPVRVFWQSADGSGGMERLTGGKNQFPNSWSPDGSRLVFCELSPTAGYDLWVQRIGDHEAQPFLRTRFNEFAAQVSPDGRWLAYTSDESGRNEIYVRPYPGPGGKWQVSTNGGAEAMWNRNGRELFYRSGNAMMVVAITTQAGFVAGTPRKLFEGPYVQTSRGVQQYDVTSDGQRFLMMKPVDEEPPAVTQINVVLNWFEELKQKVPASLRN